MPILENLSQHLGLQQNPFPSDPMFQLTQMGKQKAHSFEGGGPELAVLNALDVGGPSDLNEITRRTGFDSEKCKFIIRKLINQKLVVKV